MIQIRIKTTTFILESFITKWKFKWIKKSIFVIVQVKKFTENYMVSLNMNFPGFWVNLKKKNQIIHQSQTTYQYII